MRKLYFFEEIVPRTGVSAAGGDRRKSKSTPTDVSKIQSDEETQHTVKPWKKLSEQNSQNASREKDLKITPAQTMYLNMLQSMGRDSLLFVLGPAGCGKTLFACFAAVEALKNGMVEKIVITRPTVSADEELGFLPGSIDEKVSFW